MLQAIWQKHNELISRHVELQVRTWLAFGECRLEFESKVTAKDDYLGDIMKVMVKFWKIT